MGTFLAGVVCTVTSGQHFAETVDNAALEKTLQITDSHLSTLFDSLPSGTMYIVIAGSGDLYEVNR